MATVRGIAFVALMTLVSARAEAQFQNHSLGFRIGYLQESTDLDPGNRDLNLFPTVPVPAFGLNGSFYIENGFDFFAAIDFGVQRDDALNQIFVIYPELAIRYFFWEDYLRPYGGLSLSYVHAFFNGDTTTTTDNLIGFGGMAGLEYSITEQLSLGASLELVALVWLNSPVYWEPRAFLRISTNF